MSTKENVDEVQCNLENVYDSLKKGLVGEDDVDIGCYLDGYRELYNFFMILGGAFQFISSDVKNKIAILDDLRKDEKNKTDTIKNFGTVEQMITHEKQQKLLENSKYVSGSRTLLRLHRGLDFIRLFLSEVHKLDDVDSKINGVCKESYDKTLANFHPWIIRKAAAVAMHLLPTKDELLKKVTKNNTEKRQWLIENMLHILDMMALTYERVDKIYTRENLHSLP